MGPPQPPGSTSHDSRRDARSLDAASAVTRGPAKKPSRLGSAVWGTARAMVSSCASSGDKTPS